MQTLSVEPDGAAHSNFNYPSIRRSLRTQFAFTLSLPASLPPLTPFSEFCTWRSLVHSLPHSTHLYTPGIIYKACTLLGAGNLNKTQNLCFPQDFIVNGQRASLKPSLGHVTVCLHNGVPSSTKESRPSRKQSSPSRGGEDATSMLIYLVSGVIRMTALNKKWLNN